jgi:acetyl esterase/lipase
MQAPEYPYPFAIDEMYDAYTLLHQTKGRCIGMNRNGEKHLKVLLTGDSA